MKSFLKVSIDDFLPQQLNILKDIYLDIDQGDFICIAGPNGVGKTSFLKHISGEIINSEATIILDGKNLNSYSLDEISKKRAVLNQSNELEFDFTVMEVVLFGRIPYLSSTGPGLEDIKICNEMISIFELESKKDTSYLRLSGGEKQRVHLARVLAQIGNSYSNKLLLLDEPLNNLDLYFQQKLMQYLLDLSEEGLTIISIVHDLNIISKYSKKVFLLGEGNKSVVGSTKELLTENLIQEFYKQNVLIQKHPKEDYSVILF